MQLKEREEKAKTILIDLYRNGFIETIYNTGNKEHQKKGWTLKSGAWSPWYFNLRPVGACPKIVSDITYAMNHMVRDEVPDLSQIVGIEMAGVPLVSAISTASGPGCELIPYSYTRAIPGGKPRTPAEAKKTLSKLKVDFGYGGKELVEGRFENGESLCIIDDMVTDFGSKLIAKYIVEYELERRGIKNVKIEHVAVVLDREQGAKKAAEEHQMHLHPLIKFKTFGLDWLRDIMMPEEWKLINDYQQNPEKYMDHANRDNDAEKLRMEALENAKIFRGTK